MEYAAQTALLVPCQLIALNEHDVASPLARQTAAAQPTTPPPTMRSSVVTRKLGEAQLPSCR